jgi:hypothetical protein
LNEGGRLAFPLSGILRSFQLSGIPWSGVGASLLVTRLKNSFAARPVGHCVFVDCKGASDPDEGFKVADSIRSGELWKTQSLFRDDQPDESAVLIGKGWWLSSSSAASNIPKHARGY